MARQVDKSGSDFSLTCRNLKRKVELKQQERFNCWIRHAEKEQGFFCELSFLKKLN